MPLLQRMLPKADQQHSIKASYRLRHARTMLIFYLLMLAFNTVTLASIISTALSLGNYTTAWMSFGNWLVWLGIVLAWFITIRYWKKLEACRFAAAQGDQRLLSLNQPRPDANALSAPTTITLKPYQAIEERLLVRNGLAITLLPMIAIYVFLEMVPLFMPWLWALLIAILVGAFLLGLYLLVMGSRQTIEITPEGIKSKPESGGMPILMPWHEARLFACYPAQGTRKEHPTMIYELSSASHIVRWGWLPATETGPLPAGTALPFQERSAQMQALCSLIAGKTGLPLYDLSRASDKP